ncbi:MAG: carbohydrate kinase [Thermoprotei archaeon]|nr:MAG: carbohydrate kinase [Thermoprotei archaeon]
MAEPKVACIGEVLVDMIPREIGPYHEGVCFEAHFGGAPANVAVGVARLGVESAFIGAVGEDPFGEMLLAFLKREGVYDGWVARKSARTSLAFVIAEPGGERSFFFYRPPWALTADALLEEGDVDWQALRRVRVIHVSGVALSQPPLRDTVLKVMEYARENGVHVSFDPNYRPDVWLGDLARARRMFRRALGLATTIMLGYDEMKPLLGSEDYRLVAERLLSEHPNLEYVAVRLGAHGAYVKVRDGEEELVGAFKVKVVDTTGAGDAWASGFIVFKLIEGRSLKEAVLLANAVAGVKCTRRGAVTGVPKRDELKQFLQAHGLNLAV